MISVISKSLSLKYQKFAQSDCNDIGIRNFEFVTKTQFLYYALVSSFKFETKELTKYWSIFAAYVMDPCILLKGQ